MEDGRVRGFLVEYDRPGFGAWDVHGKWSLRASVTSGLSLQDVRVPAQIVHAGVRRPEVPADVPEPGALWHCAGARVGAAMSCYDTARQYSLVRKQFRDKPIASHQLIQEKLAWMISEIAKGQLLVLQVGRLKDAGKVGHEHISMAKRNNVWMALECARMARDVLGAAGITDDYPVMRHMMNLESVKTYEGTHDIHTLILGQHVTGIRGILIGKASQPGWRGTASNGVASRTEQRAQCAHAISRKLTAACPNSMPCAASSLCG